MSDADLGSWSDAYTTLSQLTRQTDARDNTSCLYYDSLGRMRGRVQRTDESCAASVADAALDAVYSYDPQGRVQSVAHGLVSRSCSYDSYSRLNSETVTIDGLTRSSSYSYDSYHRPTAVTYHGGEVVTTEYGSPGVAVGLSSSVHGELVDNVSYDEAGRMTALRLPAAGGLWRTQSYYPWTVKRNGGMLESLKVGLSEGGGERLSRSYAYNSFGDITALTEETTSYTFGYDGLGRLTSAYGRSYSYDGANRLTTFNGQTYNYYDAGPYHAVDRIGDFDRLDYDANGNMVTRNKGLDSQQTLVWNAENRLSQVQDNDGDMVEQYWYGVGGGRVKKTRGTTTTYTFFGHYEEEVTGGVTTAISHYSFGGLRIAVKRGSDLFHLHGDHLGSTSLTTAGSVVEASRAYYAYGAERAATGDLQTDRTFTGQKSDATGLLYYNARYYDPTLGTFISPDSLVPGAGQVINYNRFLYVRGNPLKYTDPSGYAYDSGGSDTGECSTRECWEEKWYWNNRWYEAHGFGYNPETDHWDRPIPNRFADIQIWADYVGELAEDLQEDPSQLSWQDWTYVGRLAVASEIYRRLPEGATSVGAMGDVGIGADFLGDLGVFFDKSGNVAFGYSLGFGAMTGINVDAAAYAQYFPTASSIDVFQGFTINAGGSLGEAMGIGGEVNVTREQGKRRPTIGGTVYYLFGTAKLNLPVPFVEIYGNVTHTWLTPRFNILRFILGLPPSSTR